MFGFKKLLFLAGLCFGLAFLVFSFGQFSQKDRMQIFLHDFDPTCNMRDYLTFAQTHFDHATQKAFLAKLLATAPSSNPPETIDSFRTIKQGETLYQILRTLKIDNKEIYALNASLKQFFNTKNISAGDRYKVSLKKENDQTHIEQFILEIPSPSRIPIRYVASKDNNRFFSEKIIPQVKYEKGLINLVVNRTLFQTFQSIPHGNELMQRFMKIFMWKLHIPRDVFNNDRITMLVEKKFVDDSLIGYGNILFVDYQQRYKRFYAYYFEDSDGKGSGYYNEFGNSLEKEFLSVPLKEATATSNQKWRFHPVRKVRIKHNGIDYRGAIGTDFFALADGRVVETRYDRNVGHMIRVKHKYGIYTEYFHANAIEPHLKVNSEVSRGEIIGQIGKTGRLCTGPHLHLGMYRMVNGKKKFISLRSLKNTLDNMPSIQEKSKPRFELVQNTYLAYVQDALEEEKLATRN